MSKDKELLKEFNKFTVIKNYTDTYFKDEPITSSRTELVLKKLEKDM